MAKSSNQQRARRRASRVSLRTLQRVPRLVGQTAAGEPIVEVGSVRLVLPHDAQFLHRLTPCSRCAAETRGPAVPSAAHLHRRVSDFLCAECARLPTSDIRTGGPEAKNAEEEQQPELVAEPTPEPVDDVRDEPDLRPSDPAGPPAAEPDEGWRRAVPELGEAVAGVFDERIGGLAAVLSHGLDEGFRGLAAGLTKGLDERDKRVVAQVEATLARRLEQLGQAWSSGNTSPLAEERPEAVALVEATVVSRLEQQREVLAAELGTDMAGHLAEAQQKMVAHVEEAMARRLEQERLALDAQLAGVTGQVAPDVARQLGEVIRASQAISESASVLGTIYATFIGAREELYERLDRVAEEAAEAGMNAARAIARTTDQRVAATATILADEVAELKEEMSATRQTVMDLADAVERVGRQASEAIARPPAKPPAAKRRAPKSSAKETGAT